jgi:hypothetical protein
VRLIAGSVLSHQRSLPVADTIERNIIDLAARQGLSLYTKGNSAGNLTNVALASTTTGKRGQKGDFISRYVANLSRLILGGERFAEQL